MISLTLYFCFSLGNRTFNVFNFDDQALPAFASILFCSLIFDYLVCAFYLSEKLNKKLL